MFQSHTVFNTPSDDTVIWRYMDFTKYFDILLNSSLFFTRVNLLSDPWEGMYYQKNYSKSHVAETIRGDLDAKTKDQFATALVKTAEAQQNMRSSYGVNCWNMTDCDVEFLWKIYAGYEQGVAIQSTIGQYKEAIKTVERHVYIGEITYCDHTKDSIPMGNMFWPILHKRNAYKSENEVRAVIWEEEPEPISKEKIKFQAEEGDYIKVDLQKLISKVILSPFAKPWMLNTIKIAHSKLGYKFETIKSNLFDVPFYQ